MGTIENGTYINCIRSYYTLLFSELFVAISVSYTPPPDVELGSNEYRAASGPVIVSCIVTGGTGNISYQWTSDCRGCPFNNAASMSIEREAVHSGDTGNHTCMATTAEVEGNANITFTVRGENIKQCHLQDIKISLCDFYRCRNTCVQGNTNRLFRQQ